MCQIRFRVCLFCFFYRAATSCLHFSLNSTLTVCESDTRNKQRQLLVWNHWQINTTSLGPNDFLLLSDIFLWMYNFLHSSILWFGNNGGGKKRKEKKKKPLFDFSHCVNGWTVELTPARIFTCSPGIHSTSEVKNTFVIIIKFLSETTAICLKSLLTWETEGGRFASEFSDRSLDRLGIEMWVHLAWMDSLLHQTLQLARRSVTASQLSQALASAAVKSPFYSQADR